MSWPVTLSPSWMQHIGAEFSKSYMQDLIVFLDSEKAAGHSIFPKKSDVFRAMQVTDFDDIKVVIIGQDPYHGIGQAHGLAFSVGAGIPLPPSLRNIYKEISAEYDVPIPRCGDLTVWAKQGVLLLNATLTVRAASAGSHQNKGWEDFTDAVIRALNEHHTHVVFMLWGSYAQKKGLMIDHKKHTVLMAPHPSPLSAHRGFLGCGHFKQANADLAAHGMSEIDWVIPIG